VGRVDGVEPVAALRLFFCCYLLLALPNQKKNAHQDVLGDPEPPGAQVPRGEQGAQGIRLFSIVFLQHQGRIGAPAVLEEVVPGLKDEVLRGGCGVC